MIGILFIYWIWKAFSNLAIAYGKNKWKYFFIGLGSYFLFMFLGAIVFLILMGFINGFETIDNGDYEGRGYDFLFTIFAGLGCYGTYKFLEDRGEKEKELAEKEDGIESIGLIKED